MKQLSYILLSLICISNSFSQSHIYEHFGVDEGLPSSEVYDVYQDKLGYVWFATDKGLSRYNGYEFENFTTKDGLPGNTILDFYPQSDGSVYCMEFHSKTLFYFDAIFKGFKIYPYNDELRKNISSNNVLRSITIDSNGTLMAGGYGFKGFISISKEGQTKTLYSRVEEPSAVFPHRGQYLRLGVHKNSNVFVYTFFIVF